MELIDDIQRRTETTVLIIEHRLEDVLGSNVDRIILVNDGEIVADMRPDELLSTDLLQKNGIREPLYVTALRYAGVEVTAAKHPGHLPDLKLEKADGRRVRDWFLGAPEAGQTARKPPLLTVSDVSFGYTKEWKNLEHISFSVSGGEMLAIVGRNGAGKSTLSKLICGFETPDSGTISLNGRDLKDDSIRERAGTDRLRDAEPEPDDFQGHDL